jgi:hypothetical protein
MFEVIVIGILGMEIIGILLLIGLIVINGVANQ